MNLPPPIAQRLKAGQVIPACPLVLTQERKLDEARQRRLVRYYAAAGAGGLAVAVHTTQFEIREAKHGLLKPVLEIAAEELRKHPHMIRIGGICGQSVQAVQEAGQLRELGYHAGLLSLAAMRDANEDAIIAHCRAVADVLPIIGFYLQPAVGGCVLPYTFWRKFVQIENVCAIKIAPFNRYQTLDVVRALAESGRNDITLYTGNDDNIVLDLLTPYHFAGKELRIAGGLLGHWCVWTRQAVDLLSRCQQAVHYGTGATPELLRLAVEVTDANAAFFDAANGFAGCIAGLHEVLRRQGLLEGTWCLNENETFGPGQLAEIDRVCAAYPHLADDDFVRDLLVSRDEFRVSGAEA